MNQLAVSLAGHDKGRIYAIVSEEEGEVLLADGKAKTIDRPKRKNQKHIRRIGNLPKEMKEELGKVAQDCDLIYVLRKYQAYQKEKR